MASIPIRNTDQRVILDEADAIDFLVKGCKFFIDRQEGYVLVWTPMKKGAFPVHRTLLGKQPYGCCIDHIDGDKLNNQRSNLRVTNHHVNQVNRHALNRNNRSSGRRGVSRKNRPTAKKPWVAQILVHGQKKHLGYYASIDEAWQVRRDAELRYFGVHCPIASAQSWQQ